MGPIRMRPEGTRGRAAESRTPARRLRLRTAAVGMLVATRERLSVVTSSRRKCVTDKAGQRLPPSERRPQGA